MHKVKRLFQFVLDFHWYHLNCLESMGNFSDVHRRKFKLQLLGEDKVLLGNFKIFEFLNT